MANKELPLPTHYKPEKVPLVWRVEYQKISEEASNWASAHYIRPSSEDSFRICLITVDVQNTFCIPEFELFVGGRSGTGAVDDNRRLTEFLYKNMHLITEIAPTMDTHQAMQIFHSVFFVNEKGEHPEPFSTITEEDITSGRWRFNKTLAHNLKYEGEFIERQLIHYIRALKKSGKYELTIWPYHAMLGGIGHALVSSIEEAVFFHSIARFSQPDIHVKGDHPLTEHYSALAPEVSTGPDGEALSLRAESLFQKPGTTQAIYQKLIDYDAVVIAGQAKSHCIAWTIADMLESAQEKDSRLIEKMYVLQDCMTPIVVPGAVDYTDETEELFQKFGESGINLVKSTEPMYTWPGINGRI